MNNNIIPIFFACDSEYIKYTMVSLQSVMENASKDYIYNIHILNSGIEEEKQKKFWIWQMIIFISILMMSHNIWRI